MLKLTRKDGERLFIYVGDIKIIVKLWHNRVVQNDIAIGIDAPREVRIVREELDQEWKGRLKPCQQ